MDIKILDNSFSLLAMIDDFESVVINRRYADIQSIVITINNGKANTQYLQSGNFVFMDDKINKVFRIYNTKKTLNSSGTTLEVTGYSIMQMFKQRITIPPAGQDTEKHTDYIENIIKAYVNSNCINSVDSDMNFNNIVIAESKDLGSSITDETRYKNLYDEIIRLTAIDDLGVGSYFDIDNKKLVLDIYKGLDKSVDNTAGNNPIIFGTDFDNILEATIEYTQTTINNYAIVAGQGEGADRTIQIVSDEKTCECRHVFFIDARDIETTEELTTRGKSNLVLPAYYVDAVINPFTYPIYEQDYDIGDIVTVVVDELKLNTRIVELTETYQGNMFNLNVTFGNKSIDLSSVFNKNNNRLANIETI